MRPANRAPRRSTTSSPPSRGVTICSTTSRASACTAAGNAASPLSPPPRPAHRALDLCCGTGDIAFALARRGAETTGLDFSEKMLEVAAARHFKIRIQISNLKFIQGDAQQIPFPDNSFDIVTVGYGLRNLASWERGLDEMFRVARPGARLIVLDFGKPPNALWRRIYFTHLKISVPLIGWLFCGNAQAYAYILESLKHYPAQLAVAEKMRALKLANVRVINLLGGAMAINYGEKPAGIF